MKFVRSEFVAGFGFKVDVTPYAEYFKLNGHAFPIRARELAGAGWHYDMSDARCLHDARLLSLGVRCPDPREDISSGVEIDMRLLGSHDDRLLDLRYRRVRHYSSRLERLSADVEASAFGDLIIDEITMSDDGTVCHEIQFVSGAWYIECAEFDWSWIMVP